MRLPSRLRRGMSSSGKHRRASHRGLHRKPGSTKRYAAYAGTTAVAGVMAAGLAAGPAGASEIVPAHASVVVQSPAVLHWRHLRHLDHLRHLRDARKTPRVVFTAVTDTVSAGVFSYSALESLWRSAGGASWAAATAACIAEHESGGRANAISPTNDYGLWQINGSHGAMASLNPYVNVRSAIIISNDGRNWGPWTTAPYCGV